MSVRASDELPWRPERPALLIDGWPFQMSEAERDGAARELGLWDGDACSA